MPAVLWIAIQLITLVVACAFGGRADERVFAIVVTSQAVASSLLVSFVFCEAASGGAVILASIPFLQLGAVISATPPHASIRAACAVVVWLLSMWAIAKVGRDPISRAIVTSLCSALTLGGALLFYLRDEFGDSPFHAITFTQIVWFLAGFLALSILAALIARALHTRKIS